MARAAHQQPEGRDQRPRRRPARPRRAAPSPNARRARARRGLVPAAASSRAVAQRPSVVPSRVRPASGPRAGPPERRRPPRSPSRWPARRCSSTARRMAPAVSTARSAGSTNTSITPLQPSPQPQTASSSAVRSKCRRRGTPSRHDLRGRTGTSPSRQPPLMVPTGFPSAGIERAGRPRAGRSSRATPRSWRGPSRSPRAGAPSSMARRTSWSSLTCRQRSADAPSRAAQPRARAVAAGPAGILRTCRKGGAGRRRGRRAPGAGRAEPVLPRPAVKLTLAVPWHAARARTRGRRAERPAGVAGHRRGPARAARLRAAAAVRRRGSRRRLTRRARRARRAPASPSGPARARARTGRGGLPVAAARLRRGVRAARSPRLLDGVPPPLADAPRGRGRRRRSRAADPGDAPDVPDPAIPVIAVTGTNGKTTTVRLLAHLVRTAGRTVAYSSTDGVYRDDVLVEAGDYSGFGGAAHGPRAARLERRRPGDRPRRASSFAGSARCHNDVAVVTNV